MHICYRYILVHTSRLIENKIISIGDMIILIEDMVFKIHLCTADNNRWRVSRSSFAEQIRPSCLTAGT